MEEYPGGSLDHNIPFIVVSGLVKGGVSAPAAAFPEEVGVSIRSKLPSLESREAEVLARFFQKMDASNQPWNAADTSRRHRFRTKLAVDRTLDLPVRRSRLPAGFEMPPSSPAVMHSPFSPLSTESPLYPDGLVDARWLRKHQELVPSLYVCFYALEPDPTTASLRDNQLKADVNAAKLELLQSGYKTRFVLVLLSNSSSSSSSSSQADEKERLDTLRRGVGLETNKSFFVVGRQKTPADLEAAADNVAVALYALAGDYYRDMSRHARKKRSRGVAPQPAVPPASVPGVSSTRTLPVQGWNVRYDFKNAVFAEFRQDMDAAARSYEACYEALLGVDVIEAAPSWSARWAEARQLADVVALRVVRCLVWLGQHSAAVRRWQTHRARVADLVDRRGRGTANYAWEAWEAIWCRAMAGLVERAEVADLVVSSSNNPPEKLLLFLPPEKNVPMGERMLPWELLHHTGYWYRAAARHLVARRALAGQIPDEYRDRPAPGAKATKTSIYDVYMCPEPYDESPLDGTGGVDHARLILDCLKKAMVQFQLRRQLRAAAEMAFECAAELATLEAWPDVLEVLLPLWGDMSFRAEGWWDVAQELSWTLRAAAEKVGRGDLVVAVDWELLNRCFTARPGWHYDLTRALEGMPLEPKPSVVVADENVLSALAASFVFKTEEESAGSAALAQLSITSNALAGSAPITLAEAKVLFEGSLRDVLIRNVSEPEESKAGGVIVSSVPLQESSESSDGEGARALLGAAGLTFHPGQARVFELSLPLREDGDARAVSVDLAVSTDAFDLVCRTKISDGTATDFWIQRPPAKKRALRANAHALRILPKPPKLEMRLRRTLEQYYTNEPIRLEVEITNSEDSAAACRLDTVLFGEGDKSFTVKTVDRSETSTQLDEDEAVVGGLAIPALEPGETTTVAIRLDPIESPSAYDLRLKALYHLAADPATQVVQSTTIQLNIVTAFEASFDLQPRLHPDPWPSVFDSSGLLDDFDDGGGGDGTAKARGLAQKWCLVTRYASFALEDLVVVDLDVAVRAQQGGIVTTITKRREMPPDGLTVAPRNMEETAFDLTARKLALEDRSASTVDAAFVLRWRRRRRVDGSSDDGDDESDSEAAAVNSTPIPIPRLFVTGGEPRVLASVSYAAAGSSSSSPAPPLVLLQVAVENPSNHFLTFGLTMEPSDDFAFSGPKQTTLNVLPISRRFVTYRLLPLVRGAAAGAWVKPALQVRDKYFQKVLRIVPTEGMKADKDGILIWVPPDEDAEAE